MTNFINKDDAFKDALQKTILSEGGYTTGKNQIKDSPTNMGIRQETLNAYNKKHPEMGFPINVKDICKTDATEIYRSLYWDNTKIPLIQNDRIRNAAFDMNVMSYKTITGKTLQRAINRFFGTSIATDGIIGNITLGYLNALSKNQISDFMNELKQCRLESLKKMKNWPTAKNGWISRLSKY